MFGNSATGRLAMVTAPTITVRIAITMATMGRLMKNLDIRVTLPSPSPLRQTASDSPARLDGLSARLGNNPFARVQPFLNDPQAAHAVADLDGPDAYFVLTVHHGDLIAALEFRHRALRNQQCTPLDSSRGSDPAIPSGAQKISGVGKKPGDADRAGALIHLTIREVDGPLARVGCSVGQDELEADPSVRRVEARLRREPSVPVEVFLLADGKINLDGVDGRNRG